MGTDGSRRQQRQAAAASAAAIALPTSYLGPGRQGPHAARHVRALCGLQQHRAGAVPTIELPPPALEEGLLLGCSRPWGGRGWWLGRGRRWGRRRGGRPAVRPSCCQLQGQQQGGQERLHREEAWGRGERGGNRAARGRQFERSELGGGGCVVQLSADPSSSHPLSSKCQSSFVHALPVSLQVLQDCARLTAPAPNSCWRAAAAPGGQRALAPLARAALGQTPIRICCFSTRSCATGAVLYRGCAQGPSDAGGWLLG